MQAIKTFTFKSKKKTDVVTTLQITISEVVDPQYGLFTWPAAPVLAQYIFYHQNVVKNKNFLEIGCGTALAGLVAAKIGANVTLSDGHDFENCLVNARKNCTINNLADDVNVVAVTWGKITSELCLLKNLDIIIASDCFYDRKDFDDILFTIAYLIDQNPSAVFWTTYQLRCPDYTIEHLLFKWNLKCIEIPLVTFNADQLLVGNSDISSKHVIQMFEISRKQC